MRNRGAAACSLEGYPGMLLLAGTNPLHTDVVRGSSVVVPAISVRLVTLAPGARAACVFGHSDVPTGSRSSAPASFRRLSIGCSFDQPRTNSAGSDARTAGPFHRGHHSRHLFAVIPSLQEEAAERVAEVICGRAEVGQKFGGLRPIPATGRQPKTARHLRRYMRARRDSNPQPSDP
jgi:hypothetical protein